MRALSLFIGLTASAIAVANETALNAMPIADVLGNREVVLGYGAGRTQSDKRWFSAYFVQVGVWDRVEAGWDNDFLGNTVWNAKVSLWEKDGHGLAVGVANVSDRTRPDYYAVARKDFGKARLHAGWRKWDGVNRGLIGLDFEVAPDWTCMIDHIGGNGEYTWCGLYHSVKLVPGLDLGFMFGRPNRRADGEQYSFSATYGFRF